MAADNRTALVTIILIILVSIVSHTLYAYTDSIWMNPDESSESLMETFQLDTTSLVSPKYTHVYNLFLYDMQSTPITSVENAFLLQNAERLVITGNGTYGILSINPDGSLTIEATGTIIGSNSIITVDNANTPRWIALAQDSGEVVAVNASNPAIRYAYFTASRSGPVSTTLVTLGDQTRLSVSDDKGYLYIFTVGEDYYLEVGPSQHDEALADLPYFNVKAAYQQRGLMADGTPYSLNLTVVDFSEYHYTGNVSITVEYYNESIATYEPAISGENSSGGITVKRDMHFYLVDPDNKLVVSSFDIYHNPNGTYRLTDLPPGTYNLSIIYYITKLNSTTHKVISAEYYYYSIENVVVYPLLNTSLPLVRLFYSTPEYEDEKSILASYGIYYIPDSQVKSILVLDQYKLNATSIYDQPVKGGTLWISNILLPRDMSPEWMMLVKPYSKPTTWPSGATQLLLIGEKSSIVVLLVDDNLTPLPFGSSSVFYEKIDMLSDVSSLPAVSSDGKAIFIGTESGLISYLVWHADSMRYVASNNYIADTSRITSIIYDNLRNLLLVSSSNGLLQLLDVNSWTPLWRGSAGYPGISTYMDNFQVKGYKLDYILGYSSGSSNLTLMFNPNIPLEPLAINLTLTAKFLNGTTMKLAIPNQTVALVEDRGSIIAIAYPRLNESDTFVFYLPSGLHTINITIPGYGSLLKDYNVSEGGLRDIIRVGLREVKIHAYTPSSIGDPKRNPGYALLAGDKAGVEIEASPLTYDENLSYTPVPVEATGITDLNGTTILLIWDGVSYQVRGSLPGYTSTGVVTPLYGTATLDLRMNPVLVKVSFYIADSDTVNIGSPLYLSNVQVTVYLTDAESLTQVIVSGAGDYYYLPPGNYTFTATAPHYIQSSITKRISTTGGSVNLSLTPETYLLTLNVFSVDPTPLNIANGPLGGAVVNITMVWPVPGMIQKTLYTDNYGNIASSLRYGIYRISISHSYTFNTTISVDLSNDTSRTINLELRTSEVLLYFRDSQFTLWGIKNVSVRLTYVGSSWQNNISLSTGPNSSILAIELPYGTYKLDASAKYYQEYIENIILDRPGLLKYVYMDPAMAQVSVQVLYSPRAGNLTQGPVRGALVTLALQTPAIPSGNISAITGPDGIATFYVRQGVYAISVQSRYTLPLEASGVEIVGNTIISEQVFPGYANISVLIIDAETSAIIPNATLIIYRDGPGIEETYSITVKNGTASLVLPAGVYTFTVTYPGRYSEYVVEADLAVNDTAYYIFAPSPLKGGLQASVVSAEYTVTISSKQLTLPSIPLSNASVTLVPVDPLLKAVYNTTITTSTDSKGKVVIDSLRCGTYKVIVQKEGFEPVNFTITVSANAVQSVNITLQPLPASLILNITDTGLKHPTLESVNLTLVRYFGVPVNVTVTVPGNATILLPTGYYVIKIEKPRYETSIVDMNITGGREASLLVNMTPIRLTTLFSLKSQFDLIQGPITTGKLIITALDWDLREPNMSVPVEYGQALATLRIGTYNVVLYEKFLDLSVSLGTITITGNNTVFNLTIEPTQLNLTLSLQDSDLLSSIISPAHVTIIYTGPFGSGTFTVFAGNGSALVHLPPGNVTLLVESDFYNTATRNYTVVSDQRLLIVLTPIRVEAAFNLVDIDGNPVSAENTTITFVHEATGESIRGVLINGKIIPARRLRLGTYELLIVPPENATFNVTRARINVTLGGVVPTTITAKPQIYELTIVLLDPVTGRPARQPFTVEIERSGYAATEYGLPKTVETKNGTVKVKLPYGLYTVTVKGAKDSYFKNPSPLTVLVSSDKNVTITLEPKTYKATIVVTDDRGLPLSGALVMVMAANGRPIATGVTDSTGEFEFQSVYGTYIVNVTVKGYKPGEGTIVIPAQTSVSITLEPAASTIVKRYSLLLLGAIGIIAFLAVMYFARGKIMERLAEEEEYF